MKATTCFAAVQPMVTLAVVGAATCGVWTSTYPGGLPGSGWAHRVEHPAFPKTIFHIGPILYDRLEAEWITTVHMSCKSGREGVFEFRFRLGRKMIDGDCIQVVGPVKIGQNHAGDYVIEPLENYQATAQDPSCCSGVKYVTWVHEDSKRRLGNLVQVDGMSFRGHVEEFCRFAAPTSSPTKLPTAHPVPSPTQEPSVTPTENPTRQPTEAQTLSPTTLPTQVETPSPTTQPTRVRTQSPTIFPSQTSVPTQAPTSEPTEGMPTSTISITFERAVFDRVVHHSPEFKGYIRGKIEVALLVLGYPGMDVHVEDVKKGKDGGVEVIVHLAGAGATGMDPKDLQTASCKTIAVQDVYRLECEPLTVPLDEEKVGQESMEATLTAAIILGSLLCFAILLLAFLQWYQSLDYLVFVSFAVSVWDFSTDILNVVTLWNDNLLTYVSISVAFLGFAYMANVCLTKIIVDLTCQQDMWTFARHGIPVPATFVLSGFTVDLLWAVGGSNVILDNGPIPPESRPLIMAVGVLNVFTEDIPQIVIVIMSQAGRNFSDFAIVTKISLFTSILSALFNLLFRVAIVGEGLDYYRKAKKNQAKSKACSPCRVVARVNPCSIFGKGKAVQSEKVSLDDSLADTVETVEPETDGNQAAPSASVVEPDGSLADTDGSLADTCGTPSGSVVET